MSEQKIPDLSFDFLFPEYSKNEGLNKKRKNRSPKHLVPSPTILQKQKSPAEIQKDCMLLGYFYFSVIL